MDRRTILFVIALSLAMFGVNIYFQQQNAEKKKEWLEQQKAMQERKEQKTQEEIAQKTAKPDSLPLVKLYSDSELNHFLTAAVFVQNDILTLSWTADLPSVVYSGLNRQAYKLIYSNHEDIGTPVIYQKADAAATPLDVAVIPSFGRFDVQLVNFNLDHPEHPYGVTLGSFTDGHFALARDDAFEGKTATTQHFKYAAIALYKSNHGYLPVGLYEPKKRTVVPLQDTNEIYPFLKIPELEETAPVAKKGEEKFYVLENEYQQLVFSNIGGALAEINLPFENDKNKKSVVREIEFDREMVQNHPYNAHFPSKAYYTPSSGQGKDFELHQEGKLGGYYPLLRRSLIEKAPRKSIFVKPAYYALNIVSEYPELAELVYEVKKFDDHSITFESLQNNRRITKTYSFEAAGREAPYCINLEIQIEGDSRGLWLTSGVPEIEWVSGAPVPALKYRITRNNKAEVEKIDLPNDAVTVTSIYPDWVCNSNGFLGMIQDPLKEIDPGFRIQHISGLLAPSRLIEIGEEYERFKPSDLPGYMSLLPLRSTGGNMQFRFFAGPFDSNILNQIDTLYSDPNGYNPDYIDCQTMHGWFTFISEPFAKLLSIFLDFFHYITGSWALSIVLLTLVLRIILYPLNNWSTKSMIKMQQIGPEVAAIQEKYKKEPKKAQLEIMTLYKERGINPASGCLPMLIQMPFLIGMFDLLKSSFALRGAPFIPGWIDDLTAPDVLFRWSKPIFFIGNEFHLLPILLGLVMFAQQRFMSTAPKDPALMTDQQRQQKAMSTIMTVVFTLMFYNFPSGLNIYWLSSMLLGMLQQWYTQRIMPAPKPLESSPSARAHAHKKKIRN